MKKSLLVFIMFMGLGVLSFAQDKKTSLKTETEAIYETLNHYLEGTSYNHIDRIKKAFSEEANLYLDNRDGEAVIVAASEYASWFKKRKAGEFNGRVGKILSLEIFANVAMASAEILIPDANLRFVDMFILKKQEGEWKIISKTAGKTASNRHGNRILFVVSNTDVYGTSDIPTGNSFSEIIEAYDVFDKAGYTIDFVSPEGGAVPFVYLNMSNEMAKNYIYDYNFMYALKHTLTPDELNAEDYKAIYYVGGGSVMFNTPEDAALQALAMNIYEEQGGVIAAICHGTAGIVHLKQKNGKYLVDGKTITGYPESFEHQDKEYFKQFPFLIQKTIESRNGTFKHSAPNKAHVEVDKRVVTGQNHLSAKLVAEKMIETIEK